MPDNIIDESTASHIQAAIDMPLPQTDIQAVIQDITTIPQTTDIESLLQDIIDRQDTLLTISNDIRNLIFLAIVAVGILLVFTVIWRALRIFL